MRESKGGEGVNGLCTGERESRRGLMPRKIQHEGREGGGGGVAKAKVAGERARERKRDSSRQGGGGGGGGGLGKARAEVKRDRPSLLEGARG